MASAIVPAIYRPDAGGSRRACANQAGPRARSPLAREEGTSSARRSGAALAACLRVADGLDARRHRHDLPRRRVTAIFQKDLEGRRRRGRRAEAAAVRGRNRARARRRARHHSRSCGRHVSVRMSAGRSSKGVRAGRRGIRAVQHDGPRAPPPVSDWSGRLIGRPRRAPPRQAASCSASTTRTIIQPCHQLDLWHAWPISGT